MTDYFAGTTGCDVVKDKFTSSVNIVDLANCAVHNLNLDKELNVQFLHGSPLVVVNQIAERDKLGRQKYPAIALFQDFKEKVEEGYLSAEIVFLLMEETKNDYTPEDKYVKNYNPVLLPLYRLYVNYLQRTGFIISTIEKSDRLVYGEKGMLGIKHLNSNDYLAAVEMKLKLNINKDFRK